MIVCPWKELGRYQSIIPGLEEAMNLVANLESMESATYPLSNGGKIMVQQGTTKAAETQQIEAHRNYLDIQYIVEGQEVVGWAPVETLTPAGEYNSVKDKAMYTGHCDYMTIAAGHCYVVYPEDGHMPGAHLDAPNDFKKIVVKLKV